MCCPSPLDITSRGGVKVLILCFTSWWHIAIMAQEPLLQSSKEVQHLEVSISIHHYCHRPTTMTTTSQDNHHEDQDDLRGDDTTPHLSHPGTENQESPHPFHSFPLFLRHFSWFGLGTLNPPFVLFEPENGLFDSQNTTF